MKNIEKLMGNMLLIGRYNELSAVRQIISDTIDRDYTDDVIIVLEELIEKIETRIDQCADEFNNHN